MEALDKDEREEHKERYGKTTFGKGMQGLKKNNKTPLSKVN